MRRGAFFAATGLRLDRVFVPAASLLFFAALVLLAEPVDARAAVFFFAAGRRCFGAAARGFALAGLRRGAVAVFLATAFLAVFLRAVLVLPERFAVVAMIYSFG